MMQALKDGSCPIIRLTTTIFWNSFTVWCWIRQRTVKVGTFEGSDDSFDVIGPFRASWLHWMFSCWQREVYQMRFISTFCRCQYLTFASWRLFAKDQSEQRNCLRKLWYELGIDSFNICIFLTVEEWEPGLEAFEHCEDPVYYVNLNHDFIVGK